MPLTTQGKLILGRLWSRIEDCPQAFGCSISNPYGDKASAAKVANDRMCQFSSSEGETYERWSGLACRGRRGDTEKALSRGLGR